MNVRPGFENGWLCFESEHREKRRLAPVPESWETVSVKELWRLCEEAVRVTDNRI